MAGIHYDGVTLDIEGTQVQSLAFSPDGTKLYAGDSTTYQYTLATAWDLSTASYDGSFDHSPYIATGTSPTRLAFYPDGTRMYATSSSTDGVTIRQYALATAWDVSTASPDGESLDETTSSATLFAFTPDGTKLYSFANGVIDQYTLATDWDVSTASYDGVSFSYSGHTATSKVFQFSSDGTRLVVHSDDPDHIIYQYTLATAWDMSTASYDGVDFVYDNLDIYPSTISFSTDWRKMYTVDFVPGVIYQYSAAI